MRALQSGLREKGFNIGTTESPVTPVFLNGAIPDATALTFDLRENHGIFCSIVVYPVVPKGVIMLRLIPTAVHTLDDVQETIAAFEAMAAKLDKGLYSKAAATAANGCRTSLLRRISAGCPTGQPAFCFCTMLRASGKASFAETAFFVTKWPLKQGKGF